MGRDVVHLPGDGDALGLHPAARLGVAAALGGNRALLDGAGALLVLVQGVAGEGGGQGQGHVLEHGELRQDARLLRRRRSEQQHEAHDHARDSRLGPRSRRGQGEQRDEGPGHGKGDAVQLRLKQTPADQAPHEHGPGELAPQHERQRGERDGQKREARGHHSLDAHEPAHELVGDEQVNGHGELQAAEPEGPRRDDGVDEPVGGRKLRGISKDLIHDRYGKRPDAHAPYTAGCMKRAC